MTPDELTADELAALSRAYDWTDATASLIHSGENVTFLIEARETNCVVRRYRSRNLPPIRAELAWMVALSKEVAVPRVLSRDDDLFTQIDNEVYAAFEYLEGHFIEENTADTLFHLGQLFKRLHTASEEVAKRMPKGWIGWQRPTFDREEVIEKPREHLLTADFLDAEDKARCERVAAELSERWKFLADKTFIHADLHFGNVLNQRGQWFCLDFDECGFGPRVFDLGVVKFHLMAENGLEFLPNFLRGYGETISDENLSLGTAARIFYAAGKIPMRLDIPELAKHPGGIIRRYLGYLESELNTLMSL